PPAIVRIEGEPGVGKSRFVRELLVAGVDRAHHVVLGQAQRTHERTPYGVVLQALGSLPHEPLAAVELSPLTGLLRGYLPELQHVLPVVARTVETTVEHVHICRAMRELLAAAGRIVFVVEDLHHADPHSLDLLRFLLADPPRNLSLILTCRRSAVTGEPPLGDSYSAARDTASVTVELEPLTVGDVQQLASDLLDSRQVPPEFASRLVAATAGLPFVVEEVLRSWHNGDVGEAGEATVLPESGYV